VGGGVTSKGKTAACAVTIGTAAGLSRVPHVVAQGTAGTLGLAATYYCT
jgi:hypothetical protein